MKIETDLFMYLVLGTYLVGFRKQNYVTAMIFRIKVYISRKYAYLRYLKVGYLKSGAYKRTGTFLRRSLTVNILRAYEREAAFLK